MIREVPPQRTLHIHSSPATAGVAPLEAGEGSLFLLRRLHSLSGIFPIGAFLVSKPPLNPALVLFPGR